MINDTEPYPTDADAWPGESTIEQRLKAASQIDAIIDADPFPPEYLKFALTRSWRNAEGAFAKAKQAGDSARAGRARILADTLRRALEAIGSC